MKESPRPIWIRRDKNGKGDVIFKVVESYRNEQGKSRQRHRLHWGTLPTDQLEKLKSKYNEAIEQERLVEAGRIFEKMKQLKGALEEKKAVVKRWKNDGTRTQKNGAYSSAIKSSAHFKHELAFFIEPLHLRKARREDIRTMEKLLEITYWVAKFRETLKKK